MNGMIAIDTTERSYELNTILNFINRNGNMTSLDDIAYNTGIAAGDTVELTSKLAGDGLVGVVRQNGEEYFYPV
jgi:DNA-binding IclR family transcriptional regulator